MNNKVLKDHVKIKYILYVDEREDSFLFFWVSRVIWGNTSEDGKPCMTE